MDDDDVAKKEELETFSRIARESRADILTCAFDRFEGDQYPDAETPILRRWMPMGESLAYGLFSNTFGGMNSLIRKETFRKLGGLRAAENAGHEDAEFFARAVIRGHKLVAIPEALFWCRTHDQNFSATLNQYLGDLHRRSAYHEIFAHPDIHSLLESAMRKRSVKSWSRHYRRQAYRAVLKEPRLGDQKEYFPKRLYTANSEAEFRRWSSASGVALTFETGLLRAQVSKSSARIAIPRFRIPPGRRILIEVEFTTFHRSFMDAGCDGVSNGSPFEVGHRKVQIVLDSPNFRGPLWLRPSRVPETLFIRKLEVFSED
jgi:hypothetical protein